MKIVDLHTHTTFSDGTYTPEQLVIYAKEKGLSAVAITDHDTLDGVPFAIECGNKLDIEIIRGVEVSARYTKHDDEYDINTEIHIVGLFFDDNYKLIEDKLSEIRQNRKDRNIALIEKFNNAGIGLKYEDLKAVAGGNVITRAHFAKALLKNGYTKSIQECFDRYLGDGKCFYVPRKTLDYKEVISLITSANGVAILAHPLIYKLGTKVFKTMIADLVSSGLTGIEALYSTHSPSDTSYIKTIALQNRLLISGGSDFHGANKPKIDLGTGLSNLVVPYEILENLKGALKHGKGHI